MNPLRAVDRNLWVAEQPLRYFGLIVGTRMTIVRLSGGDLVVISPIQPSEALMGAIAATGPVRHIVAPNLYHYRFAAAFKAAYPEATLWATAGLRVKRPELPIDQAIDHSTNSLWPGLEPRFFEGFKTLGPSGPDALDEWVFWHADSRTLILTDTAFCFDEALLHKRGVTDGVMALRFKYHPKPDGDIVKSGVWLEARRHPASGSYRRCHQSGIHL